MNFLKKYKNRINLIAETYILTISLLCILILLSRIYSYGNGLLEMLTQIYDTNFLTIRNLWYIDELILSDHLTDKQKALLWYTKERFLGFIYLTFLFSSFAFIIIIKWLANDQHVDIKIHG